MGYANVSARLGPVLTIRDVVGQVEVVKEQEER